MEGGTPVPRMDECSGASAAGEWPTWTRGSDAPGTKTVLASAATPERPDAPG